MLQEVYGVTISDRKTFMSECEKIELDILKGRDWWDYSLHKHKSGVWAISYCESFPCFDSYDRAHEDRCYRSLIFCQTKDDVLRKLEFIKEHSTRLTYLGVDRDYPELEPYINYNDR